MEKWLEVGVCGKSLMLAGIAASLQAQGKVRISWLESPLAEASPEIKLLAPHAVLFEMSGRWQTTVSDLLGKHPGLTLIGLEAESETITAFSATRQTVFSIEALTQIILKQIDS